MAMSAVALALLPLGLLLQHTWLIWLGSVAWIIAAGAAIGYLVGGWWLRDARGGASLGAALALLFFPGIFLLYAWLIGRF